MLARARIESGEWGEAVKSYEQARQIYSRLAAEQSDKFSYRSKLASLTASLAKAETRSQQYALAPQHYAEALQFTEQLVAKFPNEPEALYVRALVYFDSENFGKDRFDEAIRDLRELVHLRPMEIRYLSLLSGALNNAAGHDQGRRQKKEVESMYTESVAIDRKLLESRPSDPNFRHDLANALFNYGGFVRNRPAEALPLREEAGALLRQLVKDFSSNVRYRHMLARNQDEVGLLLARLHRPNDAIPALREAVLFMEQLPENYPHPLVRRWRLADFTKDLASILAEQGQWDEASAHLDKAISLLIATPSLFQNQEFRGMATESLTESLYLFIRGSNAQGKSEAARNRLKEMSKTLWSRNDEGAVLSLALAYVKGGLVSEAIAEAEAVAAAGPNSVEHLYDAACVVSLASASAKDAKVKEGHAKRALEILNLAVKTGWKDAAHMKKDTDLDPLRDREDFKKLMESLTKVESKK
jgi:tetratricopeptide (TPR) repeat protein